MRRTLGNQTTCELRTPVCRNSTAKCGVKNIFYKLKKIRKILWSGRPDSNRGPPAPKAGALPGCATPRHEVRNDYKALPNGNLAPPVQFGLQLCQNCAK